jgi:hypothetical protein
MNPHRDVDARLERVKSLWREIETTPKHSARYEVLTDEIRAAAVAYLTGIDAAIAADRRRNTIDRRQRDTAHEGLARRQSCRRR